MAHPRRCLAFAAVITASVMDLLDSTIAQVAAPSIRRDLGGSYAVIEWLTASYALAMAVALLTGGRPPALRSAVAVAAVCGAIVMRRRTLPANLFALAWLVVALVNPADLFTAGCQLSFLAVAVLCWGAGPAAPRPETSADPLDVLIEQSRPAWQRLLRWTARQVGVAYLLTALIWLAVTPLAALGLLALAASVFAKGVAHYGRTGSARYSTFGHRR